MEEKVTEERLHEERLHEKRVHEDGVDEERVDEKELQSEEENLLRIGEVAAFFNVSVKAIRIYEKKGIIKPAKVDAYTGYRYYTVEQVQQLNALVELKALGFSLDEIKEIMVGGMTNEKLIRALTRKRTVWEDAISSAMNKIDAIDNITTRLSTSKEALRLQELSEEQRAWLLVKMVCVEDVNVQSLLSEAIWL